MKTIGLIGGMSWQSSIEYYRIINEASNKLLGDFHTCESIMYSVDIDSVLKNQHANEWQLLNEHMTNTALKLQKAGADFVLICTNTMHKTAEYVEQNINIPLLHIADTVAEEIKKKGFNKVGLIGTPFTMQEDFYKGRLSRKHNIEVIIPNEQSDVDYIYKVINNELTFGKFLKSSREEYLKIMQKLVNRGAEGIILGCTEIPLLIKQEHTNIPVFDTARLHAVAAVSKSLE
ncbi:aspartate/glutamate racemase family protein [Clostridium sp. 'deep sea']|uniref:aspartate/glutamate racemase family protein n=1 Tax=Clostridium sp. 'deep sea' TaxID=2779445 RepID=UPI0018965DD2|nr:aspartate/glutamate racemase family protein [Clostridium sp. 'deep sea']QOR35457.1 aspartate/glutamate racemase family protein [Clostridium sp. 'deep sea']